MASNQEQLLQRFGDQMTLVEQSVVDGVRRIARFRHEHPPVHDVNAEMDRSLSPLERVAVFVTDHVGSFGFFLIVLAWTALWLAWNTLGPEGLRFDPAPAFVLWLFMSNVLQILLMPLIMVGQNLQGRHAELRAQSDFEVNLKAEQEVQVILAHLEQQAAQIERQGELILEILRRLEGDQAPAR
jgi:uncharacterized membrane protein